jgi:hypothetical protein
VPGRTRASSRGQPVWGGSNRTTSRGASPSCRENRSSWSVRREISHTLWCWDQVLGSRVRVCETQFHLEMFKSRTCYDSCAGSIGYFQNQPRHTNSCPASLEHCVPNWSGCYYENYHTSRVQLHSRRGLDRERFTAAAGT